MATSSKTFCGICEARHITKAADFWCSECDEGLCMACNDHHSVSKSSKHHNAITIESYYKLPLSISTIANYCSNHNRKYENYCPYHDTLCCPACISVEHQSCIGLQLVQDVINTTKTSALLESIELSVHGIKTNIENIIADRQQNIVSIHEQRQRYKDEIKQTRSRVNDHLNKLEKDMLKNIDDTEIRTKAEIEQVVAKLLEKRKLADDIEHRILAIKMYASDLTAYIGSKSIETAVEKEENYFQSLIENESLCQISLNLNIDNILSHVETTIKAFGKVTTQSGLPVVELKREKDKQAQIMSNDPHNVQLSFDEITLSQISRITFKKENSKKNDFEGITVLPNGQILLADSFNKRLYFVSKEGKLGKKIPCSTDIGGPFGVTFIKEDVVAISTFSGIQIINTHSETVLENIKTAGKCTGIAYSNDTLICLVMSKGIQSINVLNKTVANLVGFRESCDFNGIAVHGKKIYTTDFSHDVVRCYTLEGKRLWHFRDKTVIFGPAGIDVDKNSNVYVASYSSLNCVTILSSDGKKFKQVLISSDGLLTPRILHFDETKNNLLVVDKTQPIFVYKVA